MKAAVQEGGVYEIRLRLRAARPEQKAPHVVDVQLGFLDAHGSAVDPRLIGFLEAIPHLDPLGMEVLPYADAICADDAGFASRFLIAPPGATALWLQPPDDVVVEVSDVEAVSAHWPSEGGRILEEVAARADRWARTLAEGAAAAGVLEQARAAPIAQVKAVLRRHAPGGDWAPVLQALLDTAAVDDLDARVERARSKRATNLRVLFAGSPRTFHRLRFLADVVWLREDGFRDQIALLQPSLVLIEGAPESGFGEWALAFHSLSGALPERGRALCDAADRVGVPVRLLMPDDAASAYMWSGLMARAAAVVVEGDAADWGDAPAELTFIRRATEPALFSAGRVRSRPADLTLVPVASDVFHVPALQDLIKSSSVYDRLLCELNFGFTTTALSDRLEASSTLAAPHVSLLQSLGYLQSATIVLLSAESVNRRGRLEDMCLDAIASGAIPVVFGEREGEAGLLAHMDWAADSAELIRLEALYRIHWVAECRWRALYKRVNRHHVWTSEDRTRLLGADPMTQAWDRPLMSAVLITKREELLPKFLEGFRAQSWADKELVICLNLDVAPAIDVADDQPIRAFSVPSHISIGQALNLGIEAAAGSYWAKMDDDDFYSAYYLEELAYFYRATQADVLGRQTDFFYFEHPGETRLLRKADAKAFRATGEGVHLSGATLSGAVGGSVPRFSNTYRNSADSEWVRRVSSGESRSYSYDSTSIVVFRAHDQSTHTWRLKDIENAARFRPVGGGNLLEQLDRRSAPG